LASQTGRRCSGGFIEEAAGLRYVHGDRPGIRREPDKEHKLLREIDLVEARYRDS
jgi:hypothetical protein